MSQKTRFTQICPCSGCSTCFNPSLVSRIPVKMNSPLPALVVPIPVKGQSLTMRATPAVTPR